MKRLLLILSLSILVSGCSRRTGFATENFGIDTKINAEGMPTYIYVEGKQEGNWPRIEVEQGKTPDNRPYVLISFDD